MNTSLKLSKRLSFGEEIANSVTHAVGAVLMLVLLPISSTYSYEEHGLLSLGFLFLSLASFSCSYLLLSTILWLMAQPINMYYVSLTIP